MRRKCFISYSHRLDQDANERNLTHVFPKAMDYHESVNEYKDEQFPYSIFDLRIHHPVIGHQRF